MTLRGQANYAIVTDDAEKLVIRDLGPWDRHPTVTNDAAGVVRELAPRLAGRRLLYYDSAGRLDELLVRRGVFHGFAVVQQLGFALPLTEGERIAAARRQRDGAER